MKSFVLLKVYVFEPQVMEHEIKEVLGASVWRSGGYAYGIIFIKDGKDDARAGEVRRFALSVAA